MSKSTIPRQDVARLEKKIDALADVVREALQDLDEKLEEVIAIMTEEIDTSDEEEAEEEEEGGGDQQGEDDEDFQDLPDEQEQQEQQPYVLESVVVDMDTQEALPTIPDSFLNNVNPEIVAHVFSNMTVAELRKYASDNAIELRGATRKADIVNALTTSLQPRTTP